MSGNHQKRTVDMQVIADWIDPESRVLDLGCGRGVLLQYLVRKKSIEAVGVDTSFSKVASCIRRDLAAYQGDMEGFMRQFADGFFDFVLCSRTLQELADPARVIKEALRVGRRLAVGFVNHGYWENRLSLAMKGRRVVNEVYPRGWSDSRPTNPVSVLEFERYCLKNAIDIRRRVYLRGDWKTPCRFFRSLRSGYALYEVSRGRI